MLFIQQFKFFACAVLLVGYGYFAYNAGVNATAEKYEAEKAASLKHAVEQIQEAQESDQQVVEQRAESVKVLTRTITKVQREIVKLPVRDCGFTHDERMSINTVYCASFPDAASCLPDQVPSSSGAPGSG